MAAGARNAEWKQISRGGSPVSGRTVLPELVMGCALSGLRRHPVIQRNGRGRRFFLLSDPSSSPSIPERGNCGWPHGRCSPGGRAGFVFSFLSWSRDRHLCPEAATNRQRHEERSSSRFCFRTSRRSAGDGGGDEYVHISMKSREKGCAVRDRDNRRADCQQEHWGSWVTVREMENEAISWRSQSGDSATQLVTS